MEKRNFYGEFVGKNVTVKMSDEKISGKLCSIDGYLNVALETSEETIYVKGSTVDYISLNE